jgi:Xaa-Pro aminopeptidase
MGAGRTGEPYWAALPRSDHGQRRDSVRAELATHELDALLITAPSDVRHLTGFDGTNGALLIAADPESDRFVTDRRYRERCAALDLPPLELDRTVPLVVGDLAPRRLGVDAEHVTLALADRLRSAQQGPLDLVPSRDILVALRMTKDPSELARLALACRITADALGLLLAEVLLEGCPEVDVARALEERFMRLGADGIAFPTIVASGPNASSPHHRTGHRVLRAGDLVVIDAGAMVDGYHSDMTRTVAVGGPSSLTSQQRQLVRCIVEANTAARAACRPGVTPEAIDAVARDVVLEAGYGDHLVHPTGHGVGLDIHEAPLLARGHTAPLTAGMVFTIEPGAYISGTTGARVEDTVLLDDRAAQVLTDLPRDLEGLAALSGASP